MEACESSKVGYKQIVNPQTWSGCPTSEAWWSVHEGLNRNFFLIGSQVMSMTSLMQLGNLVIGLPSSIFSSMSAAELLKALQSQAFVDDIITAPTVSQEIIVDQVSGAS